MWLEQTVWIWAPLACAALIWNTWRIAALRHEVQRLREHVISLDRADADSSSGAKTMEPRRAAA
jgi:hypothetical protein